MKIETNNNIQFYSDHVALAEISANPDKQAGLVQAAEQFEAIFLQNMLKSMRTASEAMQTESEEDNPFNSRQQKFYRSMYDGQLAMELSKSKGIGIADMLVQQLSKNVGV